MHLTVSKNGKVIQNLEYVYGENQHGMFGLRERYEPDSLGIEKKQFELMDLNFDGFDDILSLILPAGMWFARLILNVMR